MQRILALHVAWLLMQLSLYTGIGSDELSFDKFDIETSNTSESRKMIKVKLTTPFPNVNYKFIKVNYTKPLQDNKQLTINIDSLTNLIIPGKPTVYYGMVTSTSKTTMKTVSKKKPQDTIPSTTRKPKTTTVKRRTTTIRKTKSTTVRADKTNRPQKKPGPASKPGPTHKPKPTDKPRPSNHFKSTIKPKTTQKPSTKKPQCPKPNKNGWFVSLFGGGEVDETKKPSASELGFFDNVFNFLGWNDNDDGDEPDGYSWFYNLFSGVEKTKPTTTTTIKPTTSQAEWFSPYLVTDYNDGAYSFNNTQKEEKKPTKKSYKGYQLIRASADVSWKLHELLDLQDETQDTGVEWWTDPNMNGTTDILVSPDLLQDLKEHLNLIGIDYEVVIWDLQKAITYENPRLSKKQRQELEETRGHPLTWRRYHRYVDIVRYLEYLHHLKPEYLELIPLGRSSEGLPLIVAKLSMSDNRTSTTTTTEKTTNKWRLRSRMKPAVWVDGGAQGREWVSPAVATWLLHALLEGARGHGPDFEMLQKVDWYIMPVLNPDGYEYSHTHDRMWRKTRSKRLESEAFYTNWFPWNWGRGECVGVDPDRNWDYHWGEKKTSQDPCSEHYAGPHPFSEPETKAVSNFLLENKEIIKVFISLHSYSQMWLLPTTHSKISYSDEGEVMEMAKLATAALQDVYGTRYKVGTISQFMQPVSGTPYDWARARANIKYSYNVKLRDSGGPYGFLLPGSQIVPTAQEFWEALKAIVENL